MELFLRETWPDCPPSRFHAVSRTIFPLEFRLSPGRSTRIKLSRLGRRSSRRQIGTSALLKSRSNVVRLSNKNGDRPLCPRPLSSAGTWICGGDRAVCPHFYCSAALH